MTSAAVCGRPRLLGLLVIVVLVGVWVVWSVPAAAQKGKNVYDWHMRLPVGNLSLEGDQAHLSDGAWVYRDSETLADVIYFTQTFTSNKPRTASYNPVFDVTLYPGAGVQFDVGTPVDPSVVPAPLGLGKDGSQGLFDFLNLVRQPAEGYQNVRMQFIGPSNTTGAGADAMAIGETVSASIWMRVNGQGYDTSLCSATERHDAQMRATGWKADGALAPSITLTRTGTDTWRFDVDTQFDNPFRIGTINADRVAQYYCGSTSPYQARGQMKFSVEFTRVARR